MKKLTKEVTIRNLGYIEAQTYSQAYGIILGWKQEELVDTVKKLLREGVPTTIRVYKQDRSNQNR